MSIEINMMKCSDSVEIKLKHPVEEIGKFSMFIWKIHQLHSYLFAIPFYKWSYLKSENDEIDTYGPSSFGYDKCKQQLIEEMYRAVTIIENKN